MYLETTTQLGACQNESKHPSLSLLRRLTCLAYSFPWKTPQWGFLLMVFPCSFCLLVNPGASRVALHGVPCPLLLGMVAKSLFNGSRLLICWPHHTWTTTKSWGHYETPPYRTPESILLIFTNRITPPSVCKSGGVLHMLRNLLTGRLSGAMQDSG